MYVETKVSAVFECSLYQMSSTKRTQLLQIEDIKSRLSVLESDLSASLIVHYEDFTVNQRSFRVYLCQKLIKQARKSRVWKSKEFCITLRNVKYGLDPESAKSMGGRDGIFLLDRTFKPYNEMQKRIFDQFIDKPASGFIAITKELGLSASHIKAVRVVSHHMRIVGIYHTGAKADTLVLVDIDTKR